MVGYGNYSIIWFFIPLCKLIFEKLNYTLACTNFGTICITNCLIPGRCISAVIAGSEFVRLEREHQNRQSLTNGHASERMDPELASHMSAEASIKSTLQLFVKFSAEIILDSWSEMHRSV